MANNYTPPTHRSNKYFVEDSDSRVYFKDFNSAADFCLSLGGGAKVFYNPSYGAALAVYPWSDKDGVEI